MVHGLCISRMEGNRGYFDIKIKVRVFLIGVQYDVQVPVGEEDVPGEVGMDWLSCEFLYFGQEILVHVVASEFCDKFVIIDFLSSLVLDFVGIDDNIILDFLLSRLWRLLWFGLGRDLLKNLLFILSLHLQCDSLYLLNYVFVIKLNTKRFRFISFISDLYDLWFTIN